MNYEWRICPSLHSGIKIRVPPTSAIDMLMISLQGFGRTSRSKSSLESTYIYILVLVIWLEINGRMFDNKWRLDESLWGFIYFLSSLWVLFEFWVPWLV